MDIRNKNEAHKKEDFESQVASIENMGVAKSMEIIQEGGVHPFNLNCAYDSATIIDEVSGRYGCRKD